MARPGKQQNVRPSPSTFDLRAFLESPAVPKTLVEYRQMDVIFVQGDPCPTVMYIRHGSVKLSVISHSGKEAIVAMLGTGDFIGEGALAAQCVRLGTATAVSPTTLLAVPTEQMHNLLKLNPDFSHRFIEYMLSRNIRIEEDLVDQLFNSTEKRLARMLLLLARYGLDDGPHGEVPRLSQEMLAEMIGTTRSRVNFFMNKFRKLRLIEYSGTSRIKGDLRINRSLMTVVLHDRTVERADMTRIPHTG